MALCRPNDGFDNAMLHMAASSGAQFFDSGHRMLQDNVQQVVSMGLLRYYFSVDNSYVMNKLALLLWPFSKKSFHREKEASSICGFMVPREDVNSPDLYIPSMAFVTYIVLCGLNQGWENSFTPEVLGKTASSGLTVLVLEVLLLKLGFYLLEGPAASFLDFVSFSGYKYVGIVLAKLAYIFLGRSFYWLVWLYTGAAMSFFMLKTVSAGLIPHNVAGAQQRSQGKEYFVLGLAAMQLPVSWFMGL